MHESSVEEATLSRHIQNVDASAEQVIVALPCRGEHTGKEVKQPNHCEKQAEEMTRKMEVPKSGPSTRVTRASVKRISNKSFAKDVLAFDGCHQKKEDDNGKLHDDVDADDNEADKLVLFGDKDNGNGKGDDNNNDDDSDEIDAYIDDNDSDDDGDDDDADDDDDGDDHDDDDDDDSDDASDDDDDEGDCDKDGDDEDDDDDSDESYVPPGGDTGSKGSEEDESDSVMDNNINTLGDYEYQTGIHACIVRGDLNSFRSMVDAKPSLICSADRLGKNVLHMVLMRGLPHMLDVILSLKDTATLEKALTTPLHGAGSRKKRHNPSAPPGLVHVLF